VRVSTPRTLTVGIRVHDGMSGVFVAEHLHAIARRLADFTARDLQDGLVLDFNDADGERIVTARLDAGGK
jgi:hypothetical protein